MENLRRNYFVKKNFQIRYVLLIIVFFIGAALLVGWETFATMSKMLKVSDLLNPEVRRVFNALYLVVLMKVFIGALIIAILAFFISHFIAGPSVRMEKTLATLSSGDFTQALRFRKFDELKELTTAFNQMVDSLKGKLARQQEMTRQISEGNKKLLEVLRAKQLAEEARQLEDLDAKLQGLSDEFKIS